MTRHRDPLRLTWPRAAFYYGSIVALSMAMVWAVVELAYVVGR